MCAPRIEQRRGHKVIYLANIIRSVPARVPLVATSVSFKVSVLWGGGPVPGTSVCVDTSGSLVTALAVAGRFNAAMWLGHDNTRV